jgi:hypothetical protein
VKRSGAIALKQETLVRHAIREHLVYTQTLDSLSLNEALLMEGMDMGKAKDAIQFLVGAAAEYGLGAITMPAAGAGLAVGPTVQTMVDALFAAEEVLSTVEAVKNLVSEVGEFVSLVEEAINSYGGSLEAYYDKLVEIVQKGLSILGDGATKAVDDLAEKLKEAIDSVIKKVAGAMGSGIKVVIPDAIAAGIVGTALEELLASLVENAYSTLTSLLDKDPTGLIKQFVQDPSIAVDFFQSVFDQVIALLREAGGQVEAGKTGEEGAAAQSQMTEEKNGSLSGIAGAAAIKALGASGALDKIAEMLEGQIPKMMKLIDAVLNVLMPAIISCLGIYEILMKGDYKVPEKEKTEDGEKGEKEKVEESRRSKIMKISKQKLRLLIRERLLLEQGMITIMSNSYEDLDTMNRVANYALTNDIEGALADEMVNHENLDMDLDEMRGWVKHVGTDPHAFSEDAVVPDNWDLDAVYQFMEDLENAWMRYQRGESDTAHSAAANVKEREVIGGGLGYDYVSPEDIKGITFQVRRRGGQPSNINVEDEDTVGNISTGRAQDYGLTLDDIIAVLKAGGAKERKKQKPIRHTPPMYD